MMNAVWSRNAVLYEMNLRQATPEGTLAAAAERLGFLRDLGIDAVWLMPHYPIGEVGRKGSLGSYYSIRDYRAVDPEGIWHSRHGRGDRGSADAAAHDLDGDRDPFFEPDSGA